MTYETPDARQGDPDAERENPPGLADDAGEVLAAVTRQATLSEEADTEWLPWMSVEPTMAELARNQNRLESALNNHVKDADRRMGDFVTSQVYDRDQRELRADYADLRDSYRKLVNVAVGEAIGLLIAIVMIAVQIALAVGPAKP